MAKNLLPFWAYPSHWGLKGTAKELAEIDFYYDGIDAELKRADIVYLTENEKKLAKNEIKFKYGVNDKYQYDMNKLDINHENGIIPDAEFEKLKLNLEFDHKRIDEKTYDAQLVELIDDEDEKFKAALEYALKYSDITQTEYNKELKTYAKEPWFEFNVEYDADSNDAILTFDYNEYFWKQLKHDGHPGNDEREIIDNFIKDWGRKLATEDYDGDYDTKLTSINDEMNQETGTTDTGFKVYN